MESLSSDITKRQKKRAKAVIIYCGISAVILLIGIAAWLIVTYWILPKNHYGKALQNLEEGQYEEALANFDKVSDDYQSTTRLKTATQIMLTADSDVETTISSLLDLYMTVRIVYDVNEDVVLPTDLTEYIFNDKSGYRGPATPTKTGFTFVQWEVEHTHVVIDSDTISEVQLTLSPTWETIVFKLSYDLDGGFGDNPTSYDIFTSSFSLTAPAKTGYTFVGWLMDQETIPQEKVFFKKGQVVGDHHLTAVWAPLIFTITYNPLGGMCACTQDTISYGDYFVPITCYKTGYTFLGWYDIEHPYETCLTSGIWNRLSSITLVAKWEQNPES